MALKSCDPFDLPLPADAAGAIAKMQALIQKEGGAFSGSEEAGRFSGNTPVGTIEGTYAVVGDKLRITITSKPMMAPCSMIEARIRGFF